MVRRNHESNAAATLNSSVTSVTLKGSQTPSLQFCEVVNVPGEKEVARSDITHNGYEEVLRDFPPRRPSQGPADSVKTALAGPGPPDGGLNAWLQVAGAFVLYLNSWGIIQSYGAFQTFYEEVLLPHKTSSQIAWIGSIQASMLLVFSLGTGPLFDQGHFRALVVVGSVLVVSGMAVTSACNAYWQIILTQGFVVGAGAGCLFVPSVAIVATYFLQRRVFATGIATAGSCVGGIVYPTLFHKLTNRVGFGWATRAVAFVALATLIPCYAMRPYPMRPYQTGTSTRPLMLPRAFKEPPYALFTLGMVLAYVALNIPFFFLEPYAISKGVKSELPFYYVPILSVASAVGRVVPSYIADRAGFGPFNLLIPCSLGATLLAFAWIRITDAVGITVLTATYGFFSGTFASLPPAIIATLSPDLGEVGTRMGMCFGLGAIGILVGTPIAGALVRQGDDYLGTQLFCASVVGASTLAMTAARIAKTGWVLRKRA